MVLVDHDGTRRVVGSIGFHGPPDEQGRLEIGYSVDPRYRRQGFAREAVRAMFDWAHRSTASVASSPRSRPTTSRRSGCREFGFAQIGEQMDEIDGLEYVFETRLAAASCDAS